MGQLGNCAGTTVPPAFPTTMVAPTAASVCTPKCLPLWLKPAGVPDIALDIVELFANISDMAWDITVNTGERFINCVGNVTFETSEIHAMEFDWEADPTNVKAQAIEKAAWGIGTTLRQMYWVHRDERNRQFSGVGDIFIAGKRTDPEDMGGYRYRVVNRGKCNVEYPTAAP